MKIVFLDAATMGDVSFEPISRLGELGYNGHFWLVKPYVSR